MTGQIKETIEVLEDAKKGIERYEMTEWYDVAIGALEKQIPKKPIQLKGYKEPCFCPICEPSDETFVKATCDHDKYNYCPICGQKLDWGNDNDRAD